MKEIKTMTCKQIGGPCEAKIQGATAEDMLNHAKNHIEHLANRGDDGHRKILQMMEDLKKDPEAKKQWTAKFKKDFAALPSMGH